MGDWANYRNGDVSNYPAPDYDEEQQAHTCGACDYYGACPCGCSWGYCSKLCEFVSADEDAGECF